MTDRLFINIDGEYVEVFGVAEEADKEGLLTEDRAYIHNDRCFIYGGKIKKNLKNGYFYKSKKDLVFCPAIDDSNQVSNIVNLETIKSRMIYVENFKESINRIDTSSLRVFAPNIKPNDDALKKILKQALEELQIDMREFRPSFNRDYDLSNLKTSLLKDSDLTMKYFIRWCALLNLKCTITIESNPNAKHALKEPITIKID